MLQQDSDPNRDLTAHAPLRNWRVIFWLVVGFAAFIYFAGPYILGTKQVHVAYLRGQVLFSSSNADAPYGLAPLSIVKLADREEVNVRGRPTGCIEKRRYVGSDRFVYGFVQKEKCDP